MPDTELKTESPPADPAGWRARWHEIIFEADTAEGKAFDVGLLALIVISVVVVLLESVAAVRTRHGTVLRIVEWALTGIFTIEYAVRLAVVGKPLRYARSFFGTVDLLSILPTYLSLFVSGTHALLVVRALRLLRVFRVLKLAPFVGESRMLKNAIRASVRKITIFIGTVLILVLIVGALMYLIEGEENGFTSIPLAVYWAIVTMTTVGYGDLAPTTTLGKFLAASVMILGYGIIAVPTGIVTVELADARRRPSTQVCRQCALEGHDADARHCKGCGARL